MRIPMLDIVPGGVEVGTRAMKYSLPAPPTSRLCLHGPGCRTQRVTLQTVGLGHIRSCRGNVGVNANFSEHPCPPTGKTSGGCPGYPKDYIKPLACGGPDAVWNLQWQTVAEARAKDRWERKICTRQGRGSHSPKPLTSSVSAASRWMMSTQA
jgi:hypothetical protein